MANRDIVESNRLIDLADNLINYFNKTYLDRVISPISVNQNSIVLERLVFYKVLGYRFNGTTEINTVTILNSVNSVLSSIYHMNLPFAFVVCKNNGFVSIYFGVDQEASNMFKSIMSGSINSIKLQNEFLDSMTMKHVGKSGGVITGLPQKNMKLDNILNSISMNRNGIIMQICLPFSLNDINKSLTNLNEIKMVFSQFSKQTKTYGNSNRFNFEMQNQSIDILTKMLDKYQTKLIDSNYEGLWNVCTWICSSTIEEARDNSMIYIGEISKNEKKDDLNERLRFIPIETTPFNRDLLFIPYYKVDVPSHLNEAILNVSLSTVMSQQDLRQIISIPNFSWPGFSVENHDKQIDDLAMFNVNAPALKIDESIKIGTVIDSVINYRIGFKDIVSHVGIFGLNGTGKSNTTQVLMKNLNDNGIPFLVIEPVGKEHWRMKEFNKLYVYSAGDDGLKLQFNPMYPSPNTKIGNHIENMLIAFKNQSEFLTPLPEAMRIVLSTIYEEFGFSAEDRVLKQETRVFPTLRDVLNRISSIIDSKTIYTERVNKEVKAALDMRVSTLLSGSPGTIFNSNIPLNVKQLIENPTIIELDELAHEAKNFTMSMIMILVDEYIRNRPEQNSLKSIIVLEEAHRFFNKRISKESINSKSLVTEYFADLLCEVRKFGYGVVIVDQRPSSLDSNAIANTTTKVVHALADFEDVNSISYSLKLNDLQKKVIRDLKRGEAIIGVIGHTEVCKVKIDYLEETHMPLSACMICAKSDCNFNKVKNNNIKGINQMIAEANELQLDGLNDNRIVNWFNRRIKEINFTKFEPDYLCIVGQIISSLSFSNSEKRRLIKLVMSKEGLQNDT